MFVNIPAEISPFYMIFHTICYMYVHAYSTRFILLFEVSRHFLPGILVKFLNYLFPIYSLTIHIKILQSIFIHCCCACCLQSFCWKVRMVKQFHLAKQLSITALDIHNNQTLFRPWCQWSAMDSSKIRRMNLKKKILVIQTLSTPISYFTVC